MIYARHTPMMDELITSISLWDENEIQGDADEIDALAPPIREVCK